MRPLLTLVIEADQRFLSDGLDRASVVVHRRNSHENQPRSPQRLRLIANRTIKSIAPAPDQPKALLWIFRWKGRPRFLAFGMERLRSGGSEIFELFLPR